MLIDRNNKTNFILTIDFTTNQNHIKYIEIIYYHIMRLINDKKLNIKYIQSSFILANRLIKAFLTKLFKKC